MTRLRQRVTECDALKLVLEHLAEVPRNVDKPTADGAPDFVVTRANGDTVGVEVTETADPAFAKGSAAFQRLGHTLQSRLKSPVRVRLESTESFVERLAAEDPEPILVALLSLAQEHIDHGRARTKYQGDELRRHGVQFVRSVVIGPATTSLVWPSVQRVAFRASENVQERVDQKKDKLAAYRRHAPAAVEWWLVLLGGERLDSAEAAEHIRKAEVRTPFDRVFFVDRTTRVALEVRRVP